MSQREAWGSLVLAGQAREDRRVDRAVLHLVRARPVERVARVARALDQVARVVDLGRGRC